MASTGSSDSSTTAIISDDGEELLHSGPLACRQNYSQYTQEQHDVWRILYHRQIQNLQDKASTEWLEGMQKIGMSDRAIPKFTEISKNLERLTQWKPVPVTGYLPTIDFFGYIARREFPTSVFLRRRDQLDYLEEPDIFHDAFGHIPMHAHPIFADFLQTYGKVGLQAKNEQQYLELSRLYWFTVEFGLIMDRGKIKLYGSGLMSSIGESQYCLTDAVEKKPFILEDVVNQDYDISKYQPVLFVLDSFEQLYEAMVHKAQQFGLNI